MHRPSCCILNARDLLIACRHTTKSESKCSATSQQVWRPYCS
jgi:hypothetical protein